MRRTQPSRAKSRILKLPGPGHGLLHGYAMDERLLNELPAWLTEAGLAGASEADIVTGFCDRCVAAGIPLGRAHVFIDTLHPVHEGRLFRWG
jgi:hypothetical protein